MLQSCCALGHANIRVNLEISSVNNLEREITMSQQVGAATPKVEEYLETIYNMAMEGETVIGARLAEKFQVSAPTVTEMLKRLLRDGYVEMDNKRHVTLTEAGIEAAEAVLRRHRLTERFLVDMLGMAMPAQDGLRSLN